MKSLKYLAAGAAALTMSIPAQAADIIVGKPNWPAAQATAHVLKIVIEENLGLDVELQTGNNAVIFEGMDKGSMHVHPEVWLPNQANLHDKFVTQNGTVRMNPNGVDQFQGMCVTKYTADEYGVSKISDLTNPDISKIFDTDGDDIGEVWIGGTGWASTNVEKVRAKSYGYAETMHLKELGQSLAMAELKAAVTKEQPFVFYCWKPSFLFELYDLVILEEPEHDASKWTVFQPTDDAEWLENSSAAVAWPLGSMNIHYSTSLETSHPEVASLLSKVKLDSDTNALMDYALAIEKQEAHDFALKWVADNSDTVAKWLQ